MNTLLIAVAMLQVSPVEQGQDLAKACLIEQASTIAKGSKESAETIFDVARNRCATKIKSVAIRANAMSAMQGTGYNPANGERVVARFIDMVRPAVLDAIISAR